MIRPIIVFAVLTVLSCATTNDSSDRYTRAAMSWTGASIGEMVAAWGTPNAGYLPGDGEKDGIAGWDVRYESGIGDRKVTHYHCAAYAYFDASNKIVRIDVRRSHNCHRRFENRFDLMTRNRAIRI